MVGPRTVAARPRPILGLASSAASGLRQAVRCSAAQHAVVRRAVPRPEVARECRYRVLRVRVCRWVATRPGECAWDLRRRATRSSYSRLARIRPAVCGRRDARGRLPPAVR